MWGRIREIVKKELYQALREPRMRVVLFFPPLVQLLIFGYAVNLDVENIPFAWMDADRTPASRALLAAFEGSRHFQLVAVPEHEAEVRSVLDRGEAHTVIRVLPGFGQSIQRGQPSSIQILVDGTNSNTAAIVSGYAGQVIGLFSTQLRTAVGSEIVHRNLPSLSVQSRVWFNPELKSRNYFVPGVVVNIITLVTLMLTAMAIVREKEIGTMEQLMVTPIRPVELMIGKTLPFACIGFVEIGLVVAAALLIFGIPFHGSLLLLILSSGLFLLTTLGAGLFISTVSRTQQQALMASFFFFTPAFMLSGFTFPIPNMPAPVQYLSLLNPVRYFMEIVRGIFLKGVGFEILWPKMLALLLLGGTILLASAWRFRKRLD
jgi:ABC-2 type transport system permease protein